MLHSLSNAAFHAYISPASCSVRGRTADGFVNLTGERIYDWILVYHRKAKTICLESQQSLRKFRQGSLLTIVAYGIEWFDAVWASFSNFRLVPPPTVEGRHPRLPHSRCRIKISSRDVVQLQSHSSRPW